MSVIVKGMLMPCGCADCDFVSGVIYDSKGFATYSCYAQVDGNRLCKDVTAEVITMCMGEAKEGIYPDWCPLEEVDDEICD